MKYTPICPDSDLAAEAELEEEAAADFASLRDEAAPKLPTLPEWPCCPFHGAHDAAEDGFPLSFCERCEKAGMVRRPR